MIHPSSPVRRRRGFTLVEMIVAAAVGALLIASLMSAYIQQRRAFRVQQNLAEMQQVVRSALDILAHDLRNAGYGMEVPVIRYPQWIDWTPNITGPATIFPGSAGASDRIVLVGAFGPPAASLSLGSVARTQAIVLGPGEGDRFNTTTRKVILVGKVETARVLAVAGDTLTVSTHPTNNSVPLRFAHEAGTPVELIQAVEYSIRQESPGVYPDGPYLARVDLAAPAAAPRDRLMATLIEELRATVDGQEVTVSLTGRTRQPDIHTTGDGHRRFTLSTSVHLRNLRLP